MGGAGGRRGATQHMAPAAVSPSARGQGRWLPPKSRQGGPPASASRVNRHRGSGAWCLARVKKIQTFAGAQATSGAQVPRPCLSQSSPGVRRRGPASAASPLLLRLCLPSSSPSCFWKGVFESAYPRRAGFCEQFPFPRSDLSFQGLSSRTRSPSALATPPTGVAKPRRLSSHAPPGLPACGTADTSCPQGLSGIPHADPSATKLALALLLIFSHDTMGRREL